MNSLLDLSANCGIYFSGNYGTTWSIFNNLPSLSYSINSIACSSSGQNVYWISDPSNSIWYANSYLNTYSNSVLNNNIIWFTTGTWGSWSTSYNTGSPNLNTIACSSSGQYMIASAGQPNGGFLNVSNGYGVNFYFVTDLSGISFNNVACSGTGQYMFADASNGELYISNDYGTSWASPITIPSSAIISSSCCSTSGQYLYLADSTNGTIYTYSQNMDIGNIYGSSIQELQLSTQLIPQLPNLISEGTTTYRNVIHSPYYTTNPSAPWAIFILALNPGLYIFNSTIYLNSQTTNNPTFQSYIVLNNNIICDSSNNFYAPIIPCNFTSNLCQAFTVTTYNPAGNFYLAVQTTMWNAEAPGPFSSYLVCYYSLVQLA